MAKVEISQNHAVTAEEARKRIESLNKELGDKYGLSSSWVSDTEARVERSGASGSIKIEPNRVNVAIDLSFMMSAFKGPIEQRIKEELERLFKA
jgi:putative polyhydroxyalkanoate system protein